MVVILSEVQSMNEVKIKSLKHSMSSLYENMITLREKYDSLNNLYNKRLKGFQSTKCSSEKSEGSSLLTENVDGEKPDNEEERFKAHFFRGRHKVVRRNSNRNVTSRYNRPPEIPDLKILNLSYFLYNATANYTAKTYDMIRSEAYAAIYSKGVTRSYKNEYGPFLTKGQYYEYRHNYSDKCLVSNQRRGYSYGLEISV
jgi:hypothetical protein